VVQAAYYRFENKIVTRGKGHSAVAAAAYNAAEKLYDDRTGTRYDFSRKKDVYHTEILAPANAPAWVFDRSKLWNHAEQQEKRVDSQVARHFILSLPNFLPHEDKIQVTRQFLQRECVAKGMIADVCFHDFDGDKKENPHAHVLLTMREMHPSGFATKKNRTWNKKEQHQEWREKWAAHLNQHFEQHGYDAQVDHRNYEAQGIDRVAGIHEGRAATAIRQEIAAGKRKETTSAIDFNAKVAELNRLKEEIRREEEAIRKEEERLLEKLTAEQDNRKPTPEDFYATTRRVMELQAQPVVNYEEVTQEVLKTATRTQQESAPVAAVPTPTDAAKHPRKDIPKKPSKGDRSPPDGRDRTYLAVQRQLEAMGGNGWFEIGIRNEEGGYFTERTWHKDQLLQRDETNKTPILSYLKQENAKGSHIYVRPAPHANGDSQGLILIDDLDPVMAEELRSKGLEPSVIVETSRKNCQAWVRISDRVTREEATQLAKMLAQETGGDFASASYQHYGRLAGFTNRKDKHLDVYTGKYPWVLVHHARSQLASRAGYFLEQARSALAQERAAQQQALAKRADLLREAASNDELRQALQTFKTISTSVERRHNLHDSSRRDWVVLKKMAKRGYSLAAMEYALRHSDDLEARKKGHEEDYIRRTIDKISCDPDVLMTLARKKERQERQPPHRTESPERASGQAPQDVAPQAPKPEESTEVQDKRIDAKQRHYYHDRDRSSPAASAPGKSGAMKQAPGKTPSSSPGSFGPKHRRTSTKISQGNTAIPPAGNDSQDPPTVSGERPVTEDDRDRIAAMKWINDGKERGKPAAKPAKREKRQSGEGYNRKKPSSDNGFKDKDPIFGASDPGKTSFSGDKPTEPITTVSVSTINWPLGDLDAETVAALKAAALVSDKAQARLEKADWLLANQKQVERRYKHWGRCKQEYLKELARVHQLYGKENALTPYTDVEIACKLRVAGYSYNQIYKTLADCSPVVAAIPSVPYQNLYLEKGIKPHLRSAPLRKVCEQFQHERLDHAKSLTDPTQQAAYLAEKRLDALGLATPVEIPGITMPKRERKCDIER
jgi:MobA/MobL family/RepB DNA-primase from phage plasmid